MHLPKLALADRWNVHHHPLTTRSGAQLAAATAALGIAAVTLVHLEDTPATPRHGMTPVVIERRLRQAGLPPESARCMAQAIGQADLSRASVSDLIEHASSPSPPAAYVELLEAC